VTFITLGQAKFWRPSGSDAHQAPAEFSAGSFAMLSPKEVARLEMAIVDRNRRSFRPAPDLEVDSQTGWRDAVPHIRAVPRAFLPGRSNDADFVLGTQTVTHAVASLAACRISVPCHQTDSGDRGSPDSPPDDGPGAAAAGGSIATRRSVHPDNFAVRCRAPPGARDPFLSTPPRVP
jgi:hypothetical protein